MRQSGVLKAYRPKQRDGDNAAVRDVCNKAAVRDVGDKAAVRD